MQQQLELWISNYSYGKSIAKGNLVGPLDPLDVGMALDCLKARQRKHYCCLTKQLTRSSTFLSWWFTFPVLSSPRGLSSKPKLFIQNSSFRLWLLQRKFSLRLFNASLVHLNTLYLGILIYFVWLMYPWKKPRIPSYILSRYTWKKSFRFEAEV